LKYNKDKGQINQSVVVYKTNYKGKEVKFLSFVLPFDRVKLLFEFDKQKKIYMLTQIFHYAVFGSLLKTNRAIQI
jgi:hypothetical protein